MFIICEPSLWLVIDAESGSNLVPGQIVSLASSVAVGLPLTMEPEDHVNLTGRKTVI